MGETVDNTIASIRRKLEIIRNRYRAVSESSPEAVLVVETCSGRILDVNEKALKLYGYPDRECLVGRRFSVLVEKPGSQENQPDPADGSPVRSSHCSRDGKPLDVLVRSRVVESDFEESIIYNVRRYEEGTFRSDHSGSESSQQEIADEIDIAARIQTSFLPEKIPSCDQLEIDAYSQPAREVGGDYFGFDTGPDSLGLLISDVMGKGIPAALIVATIHSTFNILTNFTREPWRILDNLNRNLYLDLQDSPMFVSAFCGFFDFKRHTFHYSNAAHNPPLYFSRDEGRIYRLKNAGILCGIRSKYEYSAHTITLDRGDLLVFYTDGLTDIKNIIENQRAERFRIERVQQIIRENSHLSASALKSKLISAAYSFAQSEAPPDDISLIVCKFKGREGG